MEHFLDAGVDLGFRMNDRLAGTKHGQPVFDFSGPSLLDFFWTILDRAGVKYIRQFQALCLRQGLQGIGDFL
jgi:hypothetical protein